MKDATLARRLFLFSAVSIVFLYGLVVGRYQVFPFAAISFAKQSVEEVFRERNTIARVRPDHFLKKARYAGRGVTRVDTSRMARGLTFVQGFFEDSNEMRLVREDGSIVRRWPVRFSTMVKDTSHIHTDYFVPKTDWNIEVHGGLMLRDGSIVFNFERGGLVKMDRCGTIQWVLRRMTHHAVEPSEDGGFWVPGIRFVGAADSSPFALLTPPYYEDTLIKVSAEGEMLTEISLAGVLFSNNLQASTLFANGMPDLDLQKSSRKVSQEITHLNDVEALSAETSKHFPQFAAGDLLVSERDYNLIMVIDPNTQKIKWHQQGPWMKQHDPDFEPTGRISVFSNNMDGTDDGTILGGGTILDVDPATGHTIRVFGGAPNQPMYTRQRGKHQRLWNGNILITEAEAGRVIEVDRAGTVVWEFINRFDDVSTALILQATRYGPGYFTVSDWACP